MDWVGVEPTPPDFQSGASTELASSPYNAFNRIRTCDMRVKSSLPYRLAINAYLKLG